MLIVLTVLHLTSVSSNYLFSFEQLFLYLLQYIDLLFNLLKVSCILYVPL